VRCRSDSQTGDKMKKVIRQVRATRRSGGEDNSIHIVLNKGRGTSKRIKKPLANVGADFGTDSKKEKWKKRIRERSRNEVIRVQGIGQKPKTHLARQISVASIWGLEEKRKRAVPQTPWSKPR